MIKAAARPFPRLSVFYRCYSTTGPSSNKTTAANNGDYIDQADKSRVRWFYATDVPIRKPHLLNWTTSSTASKFTPFSLYDSRKLETAYQNVVATTSSTKSNGPAIPKVTVLEDQLFEVDLRERSLAPVYWEGPVFEVRRGTWFIADGNKPVLPCPESLAEEIEALRDNNYHSRGDAGKTHAGSSHDETHARIIIKDNNKKDHQHKLYKLNTRLNKDGIVKRLLGPEKNDESKNQSEADEKKDADEQNYLQLEEKGNSAWLISNDLALTLLRNSNDLASSMLRKLASIGGTKLVRGYRDTDEQSGKPELEATRDEKAEMEAKSTSKAESELVSKESRPLQRDVDHLVLCVHGIGQRLGQRIESVNFAYNINIFRKLLKEVFVQNEEMQEKARAHTLGNQPSKLDRARMEEYFESEEGALDSATNHRVQVIPLIWRHNIEFGMTRNDIEQRANGNKMQKTSEVSLEDITVEGITPLRSLIGDVVLDVLLFYQPEYHAQIIASNVELLNSTYRKFCEQNPRFAKNPKVSLIGHSLGSAIVFDILCGKNHSGKKTAAKSEGSDIPQLDFEVDNFFGVGSPVGMFQLLKGNHLEGRQQGNKDDGGAVSTNPDAMFNSVTPTVNNYYNVFHPSDPVAYRVDPLAHCDAALLAPKLVPFAEGSFPSQIQALQQLSQRFASEASNMWNMAASILPQTSKFTDLLKATESTGATLSSVSGNMAAEGKSANSPEGKNKTVAETKNRFNELPAEVQAEVRRRLRLLNPKAGQVDHSFQVGPLDITLVSALASHVSYFENADLANFVLQSIYATTPGEEPAKNEQKK